MYRRKKVKLVFGVGINDACYAVSKRTQDISGNVKVIWCPFYKVWTSLLARTCGERVKNLQPTYKDCTVCEEWLTFSNFKSWMETQNWKGKQLDKDILVPGNKHYSPNTCVFVDTKVNNFILDGVKRGSPWPVGVSYYKRHRKFHAQCKSATLKKDVSLGYFDAPEEAHQAWLTFKLEQARVLAAEQDDPRVAQALVHRYENFNIISKTIHKELDANITLSEGKF